MNLGTFSLRDTPYSLGQYFGRLFLLGSIPWFDVSELRFNLDKGSLLSFGSLHLVGGIFGGLLREGAPRGLLLLVRSHLTEFRSSLSRAQDKLTQAQS